MMTYSANLADDDSGNIVSIIRTPGAIEALVASVRQVRSVHTFCTSKASKLSTGAIEALVASLRHARSPRTFCTSKASKLSTRQDEWVHLRFHAARALANLSTFYGARTAIAESPGALTALVTVLETNPSARLVSFCTLY